MTSKHILSVITLCCLAVSLHSQPSAPTTEPVTDETSIRTVIEAETTAFANRDSVLLTSFYADDAVTQSAWNNGDGTFAILKGKDRIGKNFSAAFKKNPQKISLPDIERSAWFFRRLDDTWMWVNFTQRTVMPSGKIYNSHETRLMKREHTGWKIAAMYALSDHGVVKP